MTRGSDEHHPQADRPRPAFAPDSAVSPEDTRETPRTIEHGFVMNYPLIDVAIRLVLAP